MSVMVDGKEYYGIIYKIENIITNTVYIGQTTHKRGFEGRYLYKGKGIERVYNYLCSKRNGKCGYYNVYLLGSIEKYGLDAFTVDEVFDTAMSLEELNEKERYYIEKFDSFHNGFNASYGGDSMSGSDRPKGKYCKNSKRVCQLTTDGKLIKIWDSATEASNELNISMSDISCSCKDIVGKNKSQKSKWTAGGYRWILEKDYDETKDYSITQEMLDNAKGTKRILQLDNDGNVIKEFLSGREAGEYFGISYKYISMLCRHKANSKKYTLIFKDEYLEEQRLNERTLMIS